LQFRNLFLQQGEDLPGTGGFTAFSKFLELLAVFPRGLRTKNAYRSLQGVRNRRERFGVLSPDCQSDSRDAFWDVAQKSVNHALQKFFVAANARSEFRKRCSRPCARRCRCPRSGFGAGEGRENQIQVLESKWFPTRRRIRLVSNDECLPKWCCPWKPQERRASFSQFGLSNRPGNFVSRHSRHLLIQQGDIERSRAKRFDRVNPVLCDNHLVSVALQLVGRENSNVFLIIGKAVCAEDAPVLIYASYSLSLTRHA
jgi:hypothetical protein